MFTRKTIKEKVIKDKLIPYKCKCGNEGEWQGIPLTLEIDHINGISNDHRIENLRFLCPNCHSQEKTSNINKQKKLLLIDHSQKINELYSQGKSVNEILLTLGFSQASANYHKIKIILKNSNLDFKKRYKNKISKYYDFSKRKVQWPSKQELELLLIDNSFVSIGKQFGVSDNTVRKWWKYYKININKF